LSTSQPTIEQVHKVDGLR